MTPRHLPARSPARTLGHAAWLNIAGLATAALALSACGHSAPTRFFTLDPVAPASPPASSYGGAPIKVLAVHIPPALDRVELVGRTAAGEMAVHDFEHWEAPLGLTARQVLVQDLAARLPAGEVLGPDGAAGPGAALLSVDIVSFEVSGGQAVMQAAYVLTPPAPDRPTRPGQPIPPPPMPFRSPIATYQAAANGVGGEATAEGMSALIGQLADRIAADLSGRTTS